MQPRQTYSPGQTFVASSYKPVRSNAAERAKKEQKIEGTHLVDLSLEMATLHQFTIPLIPN